MNENSRVNIVRTALVFLVIGTFITLVIMNQPAHAFPIKTTPDVIIPSVEYASNIAIGDLNGDLMDDIIVTDDWIWGVTAPVYYQKYGSQFSPTPGATLNTDNNPNGNDIGDLNNDGLYDFAVVSYMDSRAHIYYQNPDHTLDSNPDITFTTGDNPIDMEIADLNNDTLNDIVYSNRDDGDIRIHYQDIDNQLSKTANLTLVAGGSSHYLDTGDMNHDGLIDIVLTDWINENVFLFYQRPDNLFNTTPDKTISTLFNPQKIYIADINGDNLNDLVIETGYVMIFYQKSDNTYPDTSDFQIPVPGDIRGLAVGDLNRDGLNDIIASNGSEAALIYFQNQDNTLPTSPNATLQTGDNPTSIGIGDLNRDGINDIAITNTYAENFYIYYGEPDVYNKPPAVEIISPVGGEMLQGIQSIIWNGSDSEGENISYSIYLSTDGGSSWAGPIHSATYTESPVNTTHSWGLFDTLSYGDSNTCLIRIIAEDHMGPPNEARSASYFMIDNNPPVTVDDYDNKWHSSDFQVILDATDAGSGVNDTYYRINGGSVKSVLIDGQPLITTEGTSNTLEYWSVDNISQEEIHHFLTDIKLDKTLPSTTDDYYDEWRNSPFAIILTAIDGLSGVNNTYYRINGGSIKSVTIDGQPQITTEGANNTLEYWSVDNASNEETHHNVISIKLDITSPTSMDDYDDEWHNGPLTVNLTRADGLSGVNDTYYRINGGSQKSVYMDGQPLITTEGANNTLEYWSVDNASNEEAHHYVMNIKLDITQPVTIDDYDGEWHNSPFTINLSATDGLSGINDTYYQINGGPVQSIKVDGQPSITTEGESNSLEYWSVDNASNEELHHIITDIKVDKSTPITSDDYNGDWYNSTFTVTLSASDDLSGINDTYYRINGGSIQSITVDGQPFITTEGASNSLEYWSIDNCSNEETHHIITNIKLDTISPISTDGYNGEWHNKSFMINLSAVDGTSGVYNIYYRINGGPIKSISFDGQPIITTEGATNTLEYWCVDNASNEESHHILTDIKLDKIPPQTTDDHVGGWHNSSFTISLSAIDDLSGIYNIYYRINGGPILNVGTHGQPQILEEGSSNTLEYWATDITGNEELPHNFISDIKVDITYPLVMLIRPFNGSIIKSGTIIEFEIVESNIDNTLFSLDNILYQELPSPYDISTTGWADGNYTIIIYSDDKAGNSNLSSYTFIIDSTSPSIEYISNLNHSTINVGEGIQLNISDPHLDEVYFFTNEGEHIILTAPFIINTFGWGDGFYKITVGANDTIGNENIIWFEVTLITIVDKEQPEVISSNPLSGSNDVDIDTTITITFSEPMNHSDAGNYISLSPPSSFSLEWDSTDTVLFISYNENNLSEATTYMLTIDSQITDANGNPMETDFILTFTTTYSSTLDSDGDGTPNINDPDDDNDGFLDKNDIFPFDSNEWLDTDEDGIGNNADLDDDDDGVSDEKDDFPLDPKRWEKPNRDDTSLNVMIVIIMIVIIFIIIIMLFFRQKRVQSKPIKDEFFKEETDIPSLDDEEDELTPPQVSKPLPPPPPPRKT